MIHEQGWPIRSLPEPGGLTPDRPSQLSTTTLSKELVAVTTPTHQAAVHADCPWGGHGRYTSTARLRAPHTPHGLAERSGSARGRTHASTLNALPSLPTASDGQMFTEWRVELDEKDGMHIKIVVWLEGHRANELHNG